MHRRPEDHVSNPKVLAEARRRGWPMTLECFADAAAVLDEPMWVPASDVAVDAGMKELTQSRRQAELRRQSDRYLRDSGLLDPGAAT